jgi:hypothetical protein
MEYFLVLLSKGAYQVEFVPIYPPRQIEDIGTLPKDCRKVWPTFFIMVSL